MERPELLRKDAERVLDSSEDGCRCISRRRRARKRAHSDSHCCDRDGVDELVDYFIEALLEPADVRLQGH